MSNVIRQLTHQISKLLGYRVCITATIILLFIFFIYHSSFITPIYARDFSSRYHVTYTLQQNGQTRVQNDITLTNLIDNIYATEYGVTVKNTHLQHVEAYTARGPLFIERTPVGDTTNIRVTFTDVVVGKGNNRSFTIAYVTDGIAKQVGNVWQISLPKISPEEHLDDFLTTLVVDESIGKPLFIKPEPTKTDNNHYTWSYEQTQKGITAEFGPYQVFQFDLTYHLANNSNDYVYEEISLPPDTAYQTIHYTGITPEAKTVRTDSDGNWLARYDLSPQSFQDVQALGYVSIYPLPRKDFPPVTSENNTTHYLGSQQYWEVSNPEIQALARELKTPEAIYRYVVKTLHYDYSRVSTNIVRFGAKQALEKPSQAICMEFTDLTVTLLRAAGIPARELNGFAYTTDRQLHPLSLVTDILHAWPEYYDSNKKTWIQIDPTWENTTGGTDYFTTLDSSHFVFAVHGISSTDPPSAGAYKTNKKQEEAKDVEVSPATTMPGKTVQTPRITLVFPKFSWKPNFLVEASIRNPNGFAQYQTNVQIDSTNTIVRSSHNSFVQFPPFSTITVPLHINVPIFMPFTKGDLSFTIDQKTVLFPYFIWILPTVMLYIVLTVVFSIGLVWLLRKIL